MALREFVDSYGQQWRAWDVTPESIEPQTRAEDYLADCYSGGWLVFEAPDGSRKRRLCPLPYAWADRPDADLERLLDLAEIIQPRPLAAALDEVVTLDLPPNVPPRVAREVPRTADGSLDLRFLGVVRRFTSTSGRPWTVRLAESGGKAVLRFTSDTRTVDVDAWPREWIDCSDRELAELLASTATLDRAGHALRPDRGSDLPRDDDISVAR